MSGTRRTGSDQSSTDADVVMVETGGNPGHLAARRTYQFLIGRRGCLSSSRF
jgi:hypothetical protein